jgi:hypothetical protein
MLCRPFYRELRLDAVVLCLLEEVTLRLSLTDETQRRRLNATCGACAWQFLPQHRRQIETEEVVHAEASEVCLHQVLVDGARL